QTCNGEPCALFTGIPRLDLPEPYRKGPSPGTAVFVWRWMDDDFKSRLEGFLLECAWLQLSATAFVSFGLLRCQWPFLEWIELGRPELSADGTSAPAAACRSRVGGNVYNQQLWQPWAL
ncbi:hypothetical protein, partial [Chromohalobacter sp. HP20-39]|uniref:hypothetical protein n=1 Tax=Chromohalobacter sp. HP20-39 TaxID=3079306 RepID=UPI00294B0182